MNEQINKKHLDTPRRYEKKKCILGETFSNIPEVLVLPHPLVLTLRRLQDFVDVGAI